MRPPRRLNNSLQLSLFLRHFRAQGGDLQGLRSRFALPADAVDQPKITMELGELRALTEAVAEAANDPFFGLHVAESAPRGAFGVLEYVGGSSATLGDALRALRQYAPLVSDTIEVGFVVARGKLVVEFGVPSAPDCLGKHRSECGLALLVRFAREFTGEPVLADAVWFSHQRDDSAHELTRYFGTSQVTFGARSTGLVVPASNLDLPLRSSDPVLRSLLEPQALQAARGQGALDLVSMVREKIRLALDRGDASARRVAAMLRMSVRTLQRRLREQGTSFQEVLDGVRGMLARVYLSDPALRGNLYRTSQLLGYSGLPAFTRAFKRWTGMPPSRHELSPSDQKTVDRNPK